MSCSIMSSVMSCTDLDCGNDTISPQHSVYRRLFEGPASQTSGHAHRRFGLPLRKSIIVIWLIMPFQYWLMIPVLIGVITSYWTHTSFQTLVFLMVNQRQNNAWKQNWSSRLKKICLELSFSKVQWKDCVVFTNMISRHYLLNSVCLFDW